MLFESGINVQPMVAPSVADDQARLRFFVASTHTDEQLVTAVDATRRALTELRQGVPSASEAAGRGWT